MPMDNVLRIAIADDDEYFREFLELILPRLGYEVVVVGINGQELLDGCRRTPPELIITDVNMPVLDGMQAVRAIWSERIIPVVFITAFDEHDSLCDLWNSDRVQWLRKPITRQQLPVAIGGVMERFRDEIRRREKQESTRAALVARGESPGTTSRRTTL